MNFVCPLCNSSVFEHVIVRKPSGAPYRTDFYQCAGCSVVFRDKDKFTKLVRFEPGRKYTPTLIHQHSAKDGGEE